MCLAIKNDGEFVKYSWSCFHRNWKKGGGGQARFCSGQKWISWDGGYCVYVCVYGGRGVLGVSNCQSWRKEKLGQKIAKCQEARIFLGLKSSKNICWKHRYFGRYRYKGGQGGAREDLNNLQAIVQKNV